MRYSIFFILMSLVYFAACSDIGDRDNPLDPGASNYVAQFDTVYQVTEISKADAIDQLYEDIISGKVDTSDGISQELIDSVMSGAFTADDLKHDSIVSAADQKVIDELAQKNIEASRDTVEVIVPLSSSQSSSSVKSSSSSNKGSDAKSSSSVTSSGSTPSSSSEKSSSSFSIEDYLNPNISYGEITDDRDGQVYKTVVIGEQTWMAQNLNFEIEASFCYNDKPENCKKYGRLYTWAFAIDSVGTYSKTAKGCGYGVLECSLDVTPGEGVRGLCPEGFHLPNQTEWNLLLAAIDARATDDDSKKLANQKLKAKKMWAPTAVGTDEYGFSGLPTGARSRKGVYFNENTTTNYWSSDNYNKYAATRFALTDFWAGDLGEDSKDQANSVRCVKNTEVFGTLTDERDGQTYKTVKIGTQNWMAENLNYAYLQPTAMEDSSSFCLDNLPENCEKYGRLYLWGAAMDSAGVFSKASVGCGDGEECSPSYPVRGVCPKGWHLPNSEEFKVLGVAGGKSLKSRSGWHDGENGSDVYGFNALPSGGKGYVGDECTNAMGYDACENAAIFWSSEEEDYAWARIMNIGANNDDSEPKETVTEYKWYAFSVRCIED